MSTLRYAESAKRVINRAVVNEDNNARIIRQLRQEIQELRLELEQAKRSPRKRGASNSSEAAAAASLAERDQFCAQLVEEVEHLRQLQALNMPPPAPATAIDAVPTHSDESRRGGEVLLVHSTLPSLLVDTSKQRVRADGVLAYALTEGTTVFGRAPERQSSEAVAADNVDEKKMTPELVSSSTKKKQPAASPPPKRSWSPTFLRRRSSVSSSSAAPAVAVETTGGGSSPQPASSPQTASRSSKPQSKSGWQLPLPSPLASNITFYGLTPGSRHDDIATRHVRITCARDLTTERDRGDGAFELPAYTVDVELADESARALLNGALLLASQRLSMRHADTLQLGDAHFFTLRGAYTAPYCVS